MIIISLTWKINEFFMVYSLIPKDMSNRIHEPLNAPFVSSLTPEQVCCLSTHQNHPNMSNCPGCVVGNHQNERLPGLGNEATVLGRVLCEACHVGESLFLFTSELCHRGTFKTQCCCHLFFWGTPIVRCFKMSNTHGPIKVTFKIRRKYHLKWKSDEKN